MLSQDAPVTNSPRPSVPVSMSPTLKDARLSVETSQEAYVSRGGKFARATMNRSTACFWAHFNLSRNLHPTRTSRGAPVARRAGEGGRSLIRAHTSSIRIREGVIECARQSSARLWLVRCLMAMRGPRLHVYRITARTTLVSAW